MGNCCCVKNSSAVIPLVSAESLHSFDETQSFSGQSSGSAKEAWSIAGQLERKYQNVEKFGLVEVTIDEITGQPVIVISRSRFPSRKLFNQKNILEYLKFTLNKYVESDYSILYFHHSQSDDNKPSFSWLKEAYFELERKYKKNLKCLYIVHPTSTIRILMNLFKPILSAKFGKKLRYVNFLYEIASDVSLHQLPIPSEVLQFMRRQTTSTKLIEVCSTKVGFRFCLHFVDCISILSLDSILKIKRYNEKESLNSLGKFKKRSDKMQKLFAKLSVLGRHDKFLIEKQNPTVAVTSDKEEPEIVPVTKQFGVPLSLLEEHFPNRVIPQVMQETITFLNENGLQAEGLFRKSPSAVTLEAVENRYNLGEEVIFEDVHLAASTLKAFLRKLPEPLLTFAFYQYAIDLMNLDSKDYIYSLKNYLKKLPQRNYVALKFLMKFLVVVVENSTANLMTISNLAIVFGPSLLWSRDEAASLTAVHTINNLIATLVSQFDRLFADDDDGDIVADGTLST